MGGWLDGGNEVLRLKPLYRYLAVNPNRKQINTEKGKDFRNRVED